MYVCIYIYIYMYTKKRSSSLLTVAPIMFSSFSHHFLVIFSTYDIYSDMEVSSNEKSPSHCLGKLYEFTNMNSSAVCA